MGDLDQFINEHDVDDEKWLRNWTEGQCEFQGKEPGSDEFEQCRVDLAERFIDSPVQAQSVRVGQTVKSGLHRLTKALRNSRKIG